MSTEHDDRIADIYRQASRETPPAHLDEQVLDRANRSVRRRFYVPFGNHWVTTAALAVIVLSVSLVLVMPEQPPDRFIVPESIELQREQQRVFADEAAKMRDAAREAGVIPAAEMLDTAGQGAAKPAAKRAAPTLQKQQLNLEATPPELEYFAHEDLLLEVMPTQGPASASAPATSAAGAASSDLPAEKYYLEAGPFRDEARAAGLKTRIEGLGYECEISEVSVDGLVQYSVRVGAFASQAMLEQGRRELERVGIEARVVDVSK